MFPWKNLNYKQKKERKDRLLCHYFGLLSVCVCNFFMKRKGICCGVTIWYSFLGLDRTIWRVVKVHQFVLCHTFPSPMKTASSSSSSSSSPALNLLTSTLTCVVRHIRKGYLTITSSLSAAVTLITVIPREAFSNTAPEYGASTNIGGLSFTSLTVILTVAKTGFWSVEVA